MTDIEPQSQWSPLAGQNIDLGNTSESGGSSQPAVSGSLPVQTIRGDTSKREASLLAGHGDSAPSTSQDLTDSALRVRRVGQPGQAAGYFVVLATQGL